MIKCVLLDYKYGGVIMFHDFNTLLGIVGAGVGFLGIALSFFFYFKSKKIQKISINTSSTILISEKLSQYENLEVFYNNKKINSLTSTTIKIKNSGTDIIEPDDFVQSSLVIKTSKNFVLDNPSQYEAIASEPKNITSLEAIDNSSFKIKFTFLNPKDYILIRVLHTGEIFVDGTLKRNPSNKYNQKTNNDNELIDEESLNIIMQIRIILLATCPFLMLISIIIDAFRSNVSPDKITFYLICLIIINMPIKNS